MANQPRLRSIIRVRVRPRKSQRSIPSISSRNIPRPQRQNLRLSSRASILSSLVRAADIRQLVTNSVGNNIWVQSFLLSLVDNMIDGLECEFGIFAAVESGFEFHGRGANAEVETSDGGGLETGVDALGW